MSGLAEGWVTLQKIRMPEQLKTAIVASAAQASGVHPVSVAAWVREACQQRLEREASAMTPAQRRAVAKALES